jgi:hypothetical protein
MTHAQAVEKLKGSKKLRLVVCSLGRVPDQLTKREAFTWISPLRPGEESISSSNPAANDLQELRRVNFEVREMPGPILSASPYLFMWTSHTQSSRDVFPAGQPR